MSAGGPARSAPEQPRGLAEERSRLAWERTGFGLVAVGLLLLARPGVAAASRLVLAGAAVAAGVLTGLLARRRFAGGSASAAPRAVLALGLTVGLLGLAAVAVVLGGPGP